MDEAAANRLAGAIKPFEAQPGFSTAQVWMRDRMNRLAQQASVESSAFGSKARSRLVLSMYNIRAAAFFRLITNIETQNNFLALLDELPHVAWLEFTGIGTPSEIRGGARSIDEGLARRKRWWIRRGYARLATLAAHQPSGIEVDGKPAKAPGQSPAAEPQAETGVKGVVGQRTPPRRKPDFESSRKRLELVNRLQAELATLKQDLTGFRTPDELKRRHPDFVIWEHLSAVEMKEIADGMTFFPKAYAEHITMRHFGITSRETLKKDRRKVRQSRIE